MVYHVSPVEGAAEEAADFYCAVFRNADLENVERYGPGEQGAEGTVKRVSMKFGDQRVICFNLAYPGNSI